MDSFINSYTIDKQLRKSLKKIQGWFRTGFMKTRLVLNIKDWLGPVFLNILIDGWRMDGYLDGWVD